MFAGERVDAGLERMARSGPVLFYIHGGAYNNGTANAALYDGTRLVERGDVVVVTVNHRLNAFGYLVSGGVAWAGGAKYKDSGNVGMLDLVLALEWVRDNIAEFGGDAGRVTIFGQIGRRGQVRDADGDARTAKGLFHRVMDDERAAGLGGSEGTGATGKCGRRWRWRRWE